MGVTGFVVRADPQRLHEVFGSIEKINKVSITRIMDENRILTIIDNENRRDESVTSKEIEQITGVLSISLAYHHFEN